MRYLIYYKIETDNRIFEEGNYLLESIFSTLAYRELQESFIEIKKKHDTCHDPIIINMFELL